MNKGVSGPSNKVQLEKILIGLVLFPVLLVAAMFKGDVGIATILHLLHLLAFVGLVVYYFFSSTKRLWSWLLLGLLSYPLPALLSLVNIALPLTNYALPFLLSASGALLLYHALMKSREFKDFELLGFLLGFVLLLLPPLSFFLSEKIDSFPLMLNFGSAFIIGTIMYSDNLWDQYEEALKNYLVVILMLCLTNVISMASLHF